MSVIVKGMKMPDCCAICELNDADDDGVYCTVLEEFMRFDELPKGRRSDCPLAELIQCRDCKHHRDAEPGMVYCPNIVGGWVEEEGYCYLAEREENA